MLFSNAPQKKQLISITPLIDVVFILLLFFMLSSAFTRSAQQELQAADSGAASVETTLTLHISLLSEDQVKIDGQQYSVTDDQYISRIQHAAKQQLQVTVTPVASLQIQHLISFIDQLKQTGIHKLLISETSNDAA